MRIIQHRPFYVNTPAHQQFVKKQLEKIIELGKKELAGGENDLIRQKIKVLEYNQEHIIKALEMIPGIDEIIKEFEFINNNNLVISTNLFLNY